MIKIFNIKEYNNYDNGKKYKIITLFGIKIKIPIGFCLTKINVGSGGNFKYPGWIGIDNLLTSNAWSRNNNFINCDLKNGLPFKDNSIDVVYSSHCLEHFTYDEAVFIISEFYRVLKPNGIMQIVVPDLDIFISKFVERDTDFLTTRNIVGGKLSDNLTDNFLMNFYSAKVWQNHCHKYAYNFENLSSLINKFPFKDIKKRNFQNFEYCTDSNELQFRCINKDADRFSLSIECRKDFHDPDYKKKANLSKHIDNFKYLIKVENNIQQKITEKISK